MLRSTFASGIFYGAKAVHRIRTKPISSILTILLARWIFKWSIRYLLAPEPEDHNYNHQEHHWNTKVHSLQYQIAELTDENAQLRAAHSMINERELNHNITLLREVNALKKANQKFQMEIKQVSFHPPMARPIL
jgi:hypothetical protein